MAPQTMLYNNNPGSVIVQPQSVRSTQRFRGPRESAKLNLEAHQFYYDIVTLRTWADELGVEVASYLDMINGNEDFTSITDTYDMSVVWDNGIATPDTPIDLGVCLVSIQDIMVQLEDISARTMNLEVN